MNCVSANISAKVTSPVVNVPRNNSLHIANHNFMRIYVLQRAIVIFRMLGWMPCRGGGKT